jgi:hypothetical protein
MFPTICSGYHATYAYVCRYVQDGAVCVNASTSCPPGTYCLLAAVPRIANRVCSKVTNCTLGITYQLVAPNVAVCGAHDRVCVDVRSCILNVTYQSVPPTLTSNRNCAAVTICPAGTSQLHGPTLTTDRKLHCIVPGSVAYSHVCCARLCGFLSRLCLWVDFGRPSRRCC